MDWKCVHVICTFLAFCYCISGRKLGSDSARKLGRHFQGAGEHLTVLTDRTGKVILCKVSHWCFLVFRGGLKGTAVSHTPHTCSFDSTSQIPSLAMTRKQSTSGRSVTNVTSGSAVQPIVDAISSPMDLARATPSSQSIWPTGLFMQHVEHQVSLRRSDSSVFALLWWHRNLPAQSTPLSLSPRQHEPRAVSVLQPEPQLPHGPPRLKAPCLDTAARRLDPASRYNGGGGGRAAARCHCCCVPLSRFHPRTSLARSSYLAGGRESVA